MVVIIIYYLFLFFLMLPFGIFIKKAIRLEHSHSSILIVLGLVFLTGYFSLWAFWFRLNIEAFGIMLLSAVFLYFFYRKDIGIYFKNLKAEWNNFSKFYKILFGILVFLTALKSAELPFVLDNESYYIQTIKWLNEYGYVKGLANLHLFLAQNSGWHTLQAGLNLSFVSDRINDLNGFLFIVCSFFYLSEFQKKHQKHWIGFIVIFNVLLFQFINAPSSDLPILLISPILFYFFIEKEIDTDTGKIAALLFLLLTYIKLTVAPLGLLLLLWFKKPNVLRVFMTWGVFFGILWMAKNSIISGYPLYPFKHFALDADWLVPEKLLDFSKKIGYFENGDFPNLTLFKKLKHWFFLSGINGIFSKGIVLMFLSVLFTTSFRTEKRFRILYAILLIHFIIILLSSPQFRFFLPEFIFFSVVIVRDILMWLKKTHIVKSVLVAGVLLPLIFLFPVKISSLTTNLHHQFTGSFSMAQLIVPQPVSKYHDMEFEVKEKGNLLYYSPKDNFFFYGTANGHLPCVNEAYLNYFEDYYDVYPQMRSRDLKDGFYSRDK